MPHVIEAASSGRAKCRGCARLILVGELRFGERLANPFADGEMTVWFHPICAAYKRPEPLLEVLQAWHEAMPDRDELERIARSSLTHRRLPRIDGAERASSGQAKCRSCRQPIARGIWRIRLAFYEEGRFSPGGFVHVDCRTAYFETDDILDRVLHFSPDLSEGERKEFALVCKTDLAPPP